MRSLSIQYSPWILVAAICLSCAESASTQEAVTSPGSLPSKEAQQGIAKTSPPLRLTLQDALARARKNNPQFQAALTDSALAREDKTQARDALLPSVTGRARAGGDSLPRPGRNCRP